MKKNDIESWLKLDNAAKIFPSTSSKRDGKVFRFACELKELVEEKILVQALTENMKLFPLYRSVLKRGAFWYYLEESDITPKVEKESEPICLPIYSKDNPSLLFRITYYQKRINLEVHHVLSDGTGALEFLKGLVYHYLIIKHKDEFKKIPSFDYDASIFQKSDDSFQKYYNNKGSKKRKGSKKAFQISGSKYSENRIRVIEGCVSTKEMLNLAHQYQTTITILTAAIFILSIEQEMRLRDKKRPVTLAIPVNLRKYFPSYSARNFFGVFAIGYHFQKGEASLESIIIHLNKLFKEELNEKQLEKIINSFSALENNLVIRAVPLFFKNLILRFSAYLSEKHTTASVSNIGKITVAKELIPYIDSFDVFISTNKKQICMCSFEDNLRFSFTGPFINSNIEKNFFRKLSELGLGVVIATNMEAGDK